MASQPLSFRWDTGFVARIDEARGLVPRSAFVRDAVERALESVPGATAGTDDGAVPASAAAVPDALAGSLPPAPAPIRAHGKRPGSTVTVDKPMDGVASAAVDDLRSAALPAVLAKPGGLRSNGHLPTCKCWRCEKLDGAA